MKRAVEYLIGRDAATNGGKPQGILLDDQCNTYDEALHGVTTFISGYYLAALRAGEEWAERMGDTGHRRALPRNLPQRPGEPRQTLLERRVFPAGPARLHERARGEVGPGCMADQLIGQWWAHQLGLGYILPKEKVQAALRSIFKYNWIPDLTGFKQ